MHGTYSFTHYKLDAYRVAVQMARQAKQLADGVPRGYRSFADQLLRAAGSTVLLIGEGANRHTAGQKRQRFSEARGECGEAAVAAELLVTFGLAPQRDVEPLLAAADRVAAMLTGLIQRHS
jgi:four helix bundle protein